MHKLKKRLILNRETVRVMTVDRLGNVHGGVFTSPTSGGGGTIGSYMCGTPACTTAAIADCIPTATDNCGTGTCSTGHD